LQLAPVTQQGRARNEFGRLLPDDAGRPLAFDPNAPAVNALNWTMRDVWPAVELVQDNLVTWNALRDLLAADRFTPGFVVEVAEDNRATLRFGDGVLGRAASGTYAARYRVGNGPRGNVGAETIVRAVIPIADVESVRNPLPAVGGRDPERLEEVRQFAPQAFRVQERAVTEADWVEVTRRHPEVQNAAARFRWTGSWTTVFVTVDRPNGVKVDADFERKIRAHLERYRIAGYDLEVDGPIPVPLDLKLCVCVKPGYFKSSVQRRLLDVFSSRRMADGRHGFFHPDRFTFGQAVYLSQIYRAAMEQPGVASVEIKRFQRWGKLSNQEIEKGLLQPGPLEIVQLDNDPSFPENGKLELDMHGGL
jgi:predicted phage baseplate assembly protein